MATTLSGPRVLVALFLVLPATGAPAAGSPSEGRIDEAPIDFQRDIRPLLSDNCFQCHGPDEATRAAGLRLDRFDEATAPLPGGGAAVVPGSLEDSEVAWRIRTEEEGDRMPPLGSGKSLESHEIELLERWIEQGAPWQEHWSFLPPARPADANEGFVDQYVGKRLAEEGMSPAPAADPATLLRRVTLDLTGLPPTQAELDAFLADPSDTAYDAVLERLFASPRYGEHMARPWLDAARYADTHGLHLDNERSQWLWREWVIEAFHKNMPFDQFTVEQLAGDLLPEPTREQLIASGFNRNNPTSAEGGMIAEEYLALYAKDRVDTTSTIWLGLTMGCAQCHDHKFDPLSQREYYSLYAFFNSLTEEASDRNIANPRPFLAVPSAEQEEAREELDTRITELSETVDAPMPEVDRAQARFEEAWRVTKGPRWSSLVPRSLTSEQGSTLAVGSGSAIEVSGESPEKDAYVVEAWSSLDSISALRLDALCAEDADLPGRAVNHNFVMTGFTVEAWPVGLPEEVHEVSVASAHATFSQASFPVESVLAGTPGWAGLGRTGPRSALFTFSEPVQHPGGSVLRVRLAFESVHSQHAFARFALFATGDEQLVPAGLSVWEQSPLYTTFEDGPATFASAHPPEQLDAEVEWEAHPEYVDGQTHLHIGGEVGSAYLRRTITVPADRRVVLGLGSDDGIQVWLDGEVVHTNDVPRGVALDQDRVTLDLEAGSHELLVKVFNRGGPGGFAFRVQEEQAGGVPPAIGLALSAPHPDDTDAVQRFYRSNHAPEWIALVDERKELESERSTLVASFPTTLVSRELEMRRPAHMLERGAYDHPGEEVQPSTPAVLPPLPTDAPRDRLGLARWIVDRDNPLTARVYVNRLWQGFFGTGLVKTAEDFGNQGEWPSHPELLDTLAVEFMESGWNVQHVQRLILRSDAYRQSSVPTPEKLERDPENRLLSRGPRRRLDAEVIRDQALDLAGLLVEKVGGPSVKPFQPPGLWKAVGYTSSNTANFRQDEGDALYRRSLYTFWKRTAPPPNLQTFDAPSREACVVRRARTNTPLQALVLMNDPQFVEAARVFGARILREGGADDADRVGWAFRAATGRLPEPEERELLVNLLHSERERIDEGEALALLEVGDAPRDVELDPREHAIHALLASLLLNLDETITQR